MIEDIDEEDYTMAGRHEQIMEDGNKAARMLEIALITLIALFLFVCMFGIEYIIGRMP
jgi:cell division protein FtsB